MAAFVERTAYFAEAPVALVIGCGDFGTGAARVLGRDHPLLIVDVSRERLDQAVETLRREGFTADGHVCDITNSQQTTALGHTLNKGPGVRVLAHIAGVGASIGDWRKMMAVDLIGPHLIAEAVASHMVRGGVAIFVGSLAGYLPAPDPRLDAVLDEPLKPGFFDALVEVLGSEPNMGDTYNYAKLGVIRLAEKLAIAWGKNEVRALSLSPGMLHTTIGRVDGAKLPSHDGTGGEVPRGEKAREIPLARQGTIVEATSVLAFLASDAASFVNGIDILVDGGHRAAWRARGITKR